MRNAFDFWGELDKKQKKDLLKVKTRYGINRWWESDDPVVILKYQIEEPFQVVCFLDYLDMIGRFLERPVCQLDFAFNYSGIKGEVRRALRRREMGIGQSEEQRETAHNEYVSRIEGIIQTKLPKGRTLKIDTSKQQENGQDGIDFSGYDGWLK